MCLYCCWVACWRSGSAVDSFPPAPEGQQLCSSVQLGGLAFFSFFFYLVLFCSFVWCAWWYAEVCACVHWVIERVRGVQLCRAQAVSLPSCSCAVWHRAPPLPSTVFFLGACCLIQWSWCGCWWMYGSVCARATLSDWKLLLTGASNKRLERAALLLWRK